MREGVPADQGVLQGSVVSGGRRRLLRGAAAVGGLALTVLAVYARALDAPFIFDDRSAIIDNPSIRRLWPLIGEAAEPGPLNPPPLAPTSRRPLPNWTFALNYQAGGLDPVGYRLVNVALHVLTAIALAVVVARTLLLPYFGGAWATAACRSRRRARRTSRTPPRASPGAVPPDVEP